MCDGPVPIGNGAGDDQQSHALDELVRPKESKEVVQNHERLGIHWCKGLENLAGVAVGPVERQQRPVAAAAAAAAGVL